MVKKKKKNLFMKITFSKGPSRESGLEHDTYLDQS